MSAPPATADRSKSQSEDKKPSPARRCYHVNERVSYTQHFKHMTAWSCTTCSVDITPFISCANYFSLAEYHRIPALHWCCDGKHTVCQNSLQQVRMTELHWSPAERNPIYNIPNNGNWAVKYTSQRPMRCIEYNTVYWFLSARWGNDKVEKDRACCSDAWVVRSKQGGILSQDD